MLYLEETIKRMLWRSLFPTKLDPEKVETIHRFSGSRILLKIECSATQTNALDVTVKNVSTNSSKFVSWEEKFCAGYCVDRSDSYINRESFESLLYCLIVAIRRMCAKHDVKEE